MKKLNLMVIVAVMAMFVTSCKNEAEQTEAQVKNPEEKTVLEATMPASMQALRIGHKLALYGYENESPEALIEAANILVTVATSSLDAEVTRGNQNAEAAAEEDAAKSFAPADLLAAAKELAGEDEVLLAMIKKVEDKMAAQQGESSDEQRGSTYGTRTHEDRIYAEDADEYKVEFQGGELATCVVIGDGSTDLDVYILDEDRNLITDDADYTDNCYCSWKPEQTATYIIRIVNRGNTTNYYTIGVN